MEISSCRVIWYRNQLSFFVKRDFIIYEARVRIVLILMMQKMKEQDQTKSTNIKWHNLTIDRKKLEKMRFQ